MVEISIYLKLVVYLLLIFKLPSTLSAFNYNT